MTYSGPQHHGEPGRKDATEPERGVAKYSTGADYVGTFLTGKRHGNGKLTCLVPNGKAVYEGAWVHGAATGECVLRYPSGVIYSGRVEDSFPHGFGKLIVPSNVPYGASMCLAYSHSQFSAHLPSCHAQVKFLSATHFWALLRPPQQRTQLRHT